MEKRGGRLRGTLYGEVFNLLYGKQRRDGLTRVNRTRVITYTANFSLSRSLAFFF